MREAPEVTFKRSRKAERFRLRHSRGGAGTLTSKTAHRLLLAAALALGIPAAAVSQMTLTPDSIDEDRSEVSVSVAVTGATGNGSYTIRWHGNCTFASFTNQTVTADGSGAFTETITVTTGSVSSDQTCTVVAAGPTTVTAVLTIKNAETITFSPTSVNEGTTTTITVSGDDFPAGATAALMANDTTTCPTSVLTIPSGTSIPYTGSGAARGPSGTFSVTAKSVTADTVCTPDIQITVGSNTWQFGGTHPTITVKEVPLVSNTTKGAQTARTFTWDHAQAFTTGNRAIQLDAAGVRVGKQTGRGDPTYTVSIHSSNASNEPGDSLGTLTKPASLPEGALQDVSFEAPSAGITLAAATTYFVVIDVTVTSGNPQLFSQAGFTDSDDEDDDKTEDWSIADAFLHRVADVGTTWGADTQARSLVISVHGAPTAPTLASAAVNGTALTLTFNAKLDTASVPAASAFTVSGGRTGTGTVTIDSANPKQVRVTLDSAVAHTDTALTVSYTKPASTPLKDTVTGALAALEVATFSGKAVRNDTPEPGTTLVSNTGQTLNDSIGVGTFSGVNFSRAITFTTGGNAAGYTLSEVDVRSASGLASGNAKVSIYTTSSGSPSSSMHVLNTPSSLPANTINTFTADAGASLDANTTYAVVFENSGGDNSVGTTLSDDEDSGAASGWSIGNKRHNREGAGSWIEATNSEVPLIAIKGTAKTLVITPPPTQDPPPNTQDPQNPQDSQQSRGQSGGSEQRPRNPQPLQLALWTDKPGYRAGETVRLYRSLEPHDDRGRYRAFAWLERAGGGERQWLAPLSAEGELRAEAVDARGQPASAARPQALSAADRELAFEGQAPGPGLWQFVLELRPGEPSEQAAAPAQPLRIRRAWAKFAVAQRSVLLNRSGFDREISSDLTLRADTLYYLGHQLFVHAGATLALEPGTLLQAFGSHAAIIVEPGGRIVAEGTREAPVVLTCSAPAGYRQPGCWAGLRILGNAPVTRLEGVAPGVLPPERPAYGGSDGEGSSGALRYVRVEFAGASGDPEAPGPAIGLYGAGSGTVLDHVQARQSLGDAFAFRGGSAACGHCVASGSGQAGLSWERGWQGGAAHLYVQHGRGGGDGLSGGHDPEGHDREPRSLPTLSNVTLVHAAPYDRRTRRAVAVRLADGTAVQLRDLLAAHFGGGALRASGRSRLLFGEGESSLAGALLWLNGSPQVPAGIAEDADFEVRDPKLRDVRDFAAPDPRPKADSPALTIERKGYIGAFGRTDNWLQEWTVFGPESVYDIREKSEDEN